MPSESARRLAGSYPSHLLHETHREHLGEQLLLHVRVLGDRVHHPGDHVRRDCDPLRVLPADVGELGLVVACVPDAGDLWAVPLLVQHLVLQHVGRVHVRDLLHLLHLHGGRKLRGGVGVWLHRGDLLAALHHSDLRLHQGELGEEDDAETILEEGRVRP
eukprot:scaffold7362_cov266-Pinguiococcus_pyrenoidosus.AAC.26